jgi:hypothetical protein
VKGGRLKVMARKAVPVSRRTLTLKLKPGTYKVAERARNADAWSPTSTASKAVTPR